MNKHKNLKLLKQQMSHLKKKKKNGLRLNSLHLLAANKSLLSVWILWDKTDNSLMTKKDSF